MGVSMRFVSAPKLWQTGEASRVQAEPQVGGPELQPP